MIMTPDDGIDAAQTVPGHLWCDTEIGRLNDRIQIEVEKNASLSARGLHLGALSEEHGVYIPDS